MHPAKAAVHAYTYRSAHPYLSTSSHQHDAASAIVHAALRTIVERLASSPQPRTAVLDSLQQLDRLPRGSKADAQKTSLVPRRRGDIHPDLTAAVLQFTLDSTASSSSKLPRVHSCSTLSAAAARHPLSDASVSFSCSLGQIFRSRSRPELRAEDSGKCASSGLRGLISRKSRCSTHASSCSLSTTLRSVDNPPSPPAAPQSMEADTHSAGASLETMRITSRESDRSQGSGNASVPERESLRRWQLLQTHVSTMAQEQTLRRELWGSAVSLALSQHTVGGASPGSETLDTIGGTSSPSDDNHSSGSDSSSSSGSRRGSARDGSQQLSSKDPQPLSKGQTLVSSDRAVAYVSAWDFGMAKREHSSGSMHD
jgi:hypothetical protein